MNRKSILFSANQQNLVCESGVLRLAEGPVNYVDATFELGENWTSFDSVRAIWTNGAEVQSRVLDLYGHCVVPNVLLAEKGIVKVNLVGSIIEDGVLTDRLTSEQKMAIVVSKVALYDDTEEEISPSQFEQFVAEVKEYRNSAGVSAEAATLSAQHAAVSEANAKASELAAKTSEDNAKASELAAKESEDNAKVSELAAKESEDNAKASELAAKRSEENASASEQAARTSEQNAASSERAAKTSEQNAADSEHAASTSEANALASERAAKTSEQNAATSEHNASTSASSAAESAASAAADAEKAEMASANAGYMFFDIDDNGYLLYTRTANTEVDFYLDNGDLFVTDEEVNNGN